MTGVGMGLHRRRAPCPPTYFSAPFVLIDVGVDLGHGVDSCLQGWVGAGTGRGVLQDLPQQQRVFGDPLHWHHQEEAEV